jgi:hypothetical protein
VGDQRASDAARGVERRGIERNLPRGSVDPAIPGRNYNIRGFDIGSDDVDKPGIGDSLTPVVDRVKAEMGRPDHPVIHVTGHASDSRKPGKGPQFYAQKRAAAVRDRLVKEGVPPSWITIDTSREVPRVAGGKQTAEQLAAARGATIEIDHAPRPDTTRGTADRYGDPTYVKGRPSWQPPSIADVYDFMKRHQPPKLRPIQGKAEELFKKVQKKVEETKKKVEDAEKKVEKSVQDTRKAIRERRDRLIKARNEMTTQAVGAVVEAGFTLAMALLATWATLEAAPEEIGWITVEEVIARLELETGKKFGPLAYPFPTGLGLPQQHHVLIQELSELIAEATGLNVHEYTVTIPEVVHTWLHQSGWNPTMRRFFELTFETFKRPPTAGELIDFLGQMEEHWGIQDLEYEHYLRKWNPIKKPRKKKK